MNQIIIIVKCNDKNIELDITNRLYFSAHNLKKFIFNKFGVDVDYYQIIRNDKLYDVDTNIIKLLADFKFMNGDILYVNNPHAKSRPCDMIGDIWVNFKFTGIPINVPIKKENTIRDLYWLIKKENTFENNFCLGHNGNILNIYNTLTVFEHGILNGDTIEIYGELIQV